MVTLPAFPKVISNEDMIIIKHADGNTYVWGSEETPEKAKLVAEQMDIELKLYAYVTETLDIHIETIQDSITSIADNALINQILNEALYQQIRKRYSN